VGRGGGEIRADAAVESIVHVLAAAKWAQKIWALNENFNFIFFSLSKFYIIEINKRNLNK